MKKPETLLLIGALALAAVGGAWFARTTIDSGASVRGPTLQYGTPLPEPQPLPHFALTSHTGEPIDDAQLRGQWNLVFFGFTHCPEVCPTTLALLADVRKRLGPDAPRVVLVSVDPERDTPEVMRSYLAGFDPAFQGITGSVQAIDELAAALGVAHSKIPMGGEEYMVDHTAVVFAVDPQGRRAAIFSPPFDAGHIASDLRRLQGA